MFYGEKALGQVQDSLSCTSAGLGIFWCPPWWGGRSGWGEGSLLCSDWCPHNLNSANYEKMDGWMDLFLSLVVQTSGKVN